LPLHLPSLPRLATVALTLMMACAGSSPGEPAVPKGRPMTAQPPAATAPAPTAETGGCAAGMVHVAGSYCPKVKHNCLKWMDPPGSRYAEYRCAEYGKSECEAPRRHVDYCIDRDEYAPAGSDLPLAEQSWTDANATCSRLGKRTCLQSEWEFACEGEEMRPYPYGYTRDANACNADNYDIYEAGGARIKDLRARHGSHPACTSPFGVRDLSGNLEEFVTIDGAQGARPAMMGAWWQPSRNHCRARQTAHNKIYKGRETGFRCCSDGPEATLASR
jgi:formylglycine-generating enzyme